MNNSGEVEYNPFLQTAAESQALWLACFPPMGDGGRQASICCFYRVGAGDRNAHHKTRDQNWTFFLILGAVFKVSRCGKLLCVISCTKTNLTLITHCSVISVEIFFLSLSP